MSFEEDMKAILESGGVEIDTKTISTLVGLVETHVSKTVEEQRTQIAEDVSKIAGDKLTEKTLEHEAEMNQLIENYDASNAEYIDTKITEEIATITEGIIKTTEYEKMKAVLEGVKQLYKDSMNESIEAEDVGQALTESREWDKVKQLNEDHETLKNEYDNLIKENKKFKKELDDTKKELVFNSIMTEHEVDDMSRDKLKMITEKTRYDSLEDFKEGILLMVNTIIQKSNTDELKESIKKSTEVLSKEQADKLLTEGNIAVTDDNDYKF